MNQTQITAHLGPYGAGVSAALQQMETERSLNRLWSHDHTLWRPEPAEITNRLGWLRSAENMRPEVSRLQDWAQNVRSLGFSQALLLGMGGSSLAPELFGKVLAGPEQLDLTVLDSTDPGAVLAQQQRLDPRRTLVIVSTKSGGTVETLSLFKYFWNWLAASLGRAHVGEHFVAITDPDSSLAALGQRYGFRDVFLNDPNIGGRYSGLSFFGLVPAALLDVNIPLLLDRAQAVATECGPAVATESNPGARLGAILGVAADAGRDKVTFVLPSELASFGDWVEQLLAESTGKEGHGLVPVVGEPVGSADRYGDDRLFVHMLLRDLTAPYENKVAALRQAGHPVVQIVLQDRHDMGAQFFLWELATAIVCSRWKINAFDQPDVESAKVIARDMVQEYVTAGQLPTEPPAWRGEGIQVYTSNDAASGVSGEGCVNPVGLLLGAFLRQAHPGAYVAVQAYLQPSAETESALLDLRRAILARHRLPVTVGYGPRFLHSTGQLHKGDAGNGLFIQITADDPVDLPIPDQAGQVAASISFGVLKAAQALGDWRALRAVGRQAIRFHLSGDLVNQLRSLVEALSR